MVRIGSSIFGERSYSPQDGLTAKRSRSDLEAVFQSVGRSLPKAVFFDQDGVLFNSMPFHAQSWELAMNENGLPFSAAQTYRNEGRTGASVINENYLLVHGKEAPQEVIEAVYAAKSRHFNRLTGGRLPDLIPGVRDVLNYLHERGVQCWVVTGSGQRSLIDNLRNIFPDILSGIITAFDLITGLSFSNPE